VEQVAVPKVNSSSSNIKTMQKALGIMLDANRIDGLRSRVRVEAGVHQSLFKARGRPIFRSCTRVFQHCGGSPTYQILVNSGRVDAWQPKNPMASCAEGHPPEDRRGPHIGIMAIRSCGRGVKLPRN
jgi:hypothetical protein